MLFKALSKFGVKESLLLLLLRENKKLKATISIQQQKLQEVIKDASETSMYRLHCENQHKAEIKRLKEEIERLKGLNESSIRVNTRVLPTSGFAKYA